MILNQKMESEFGQEDCLKPKSLKRVAVSAAMTTALGTAMFITVPRSYADNDHAKCQRQVERAESRVDQAVRKYGEHSRRAEDRRRDLNAERERCWNKYHGWWEGHERRWHESRDWDHDRDHDHDNH